jgi:CBS domain containing-hemolysin-like protein
MIPIEKVQYISLARSFEENRAVILSRNHTRFPVCKTDMTSVIGILNMKDIRFQYEEDNSIFEKAMRTPMFLPPTVPEDRLMKLFSERRVHIAIVQDPLTRQNIGIVSLEDILEELVGEIVDEHGN